MGSFFVLNRHHRPIQDNYVLLNAPYGAAQVTSSCQSPRISLILGCFVLRIEKATRSHSSGISQTQSLTVESKTMAAPAMTVWPILQQRENPWRESGPQLVPTPVSEAVLVESAKLGDQDAFAELIKRNYQFCLSKAYAILRNHGDAEDEVQNACARAWTHIWQFQCTGSFGGWLGRIVSNQCLMLLRERRAPGWYLLTSYSMPTALSGWK